VSADALLEFAHGRMSKERAVLALDLRDYAQLLLALGERGLTPPRLPPEQVAAMQKIVVGLLREARHDRALHARRS
jgi:hypothetical protein